MIDIKVNKKTNNKNQKKIQKLTIKTKKKIIEKEFYYRKKLFETCCFERKKIEILLNLVPKTGKILEVGCGYGFLSLLMLSKKRKIFATDIVKGISKKPLLKGIVFRKIDKEKFPFKTNNFDCLISTDVIEHINNESNFIKECLRVLKSDGKIILATPNIYRLSFWLKTFILKQPKFPNRVNFDPIFGSDQHLREYSKKKLVSVFKKNGWKNIKIFGYGFGLNNFCNLSNIIPQPFDFFSSYFIIQAKKINYI